MPHNERCREIIEGRMAEAEPERYNEALARMIEGRIQKKRRMEAKSETTNPEEARDQGMEDTGASSSTDDRRNQKRERQEESEERDIRRRVEREKRGRPG